MATEPNIRKLVVFRETIRSEGGCELEKPLRKCAAAAVIKNPYAGAYQEDLTLLMEYGEYLGGYLTQKAVEAMGIDPSEVHSFGKACIVGLDGEHEHAAALMHPRLGAPMRAYLGAADYPVGQEDRGPGRDARRAAAPQGRDARALPLHAITIRIPDAPHADEVVVAVAFTTGGRPHARIGGVSAEGIKGQNGLD
ncbi:MAG: amino acid synthesis family protein [Anaerotruncus massiliensis (ex Togo et al. 2019)]